MDLKKLEKNVRERGFEFFYAATAEEAVQHVLDQVRNTSVGIICILIFFHTDMPSRTGVHSISGFQARNPLTKKNKGMRNSTTKGIDADVFRLMP